MMKKGSAAFDSDQRGVRMIASGMMHTQNDVSRRDFEPGFAHGLHAAIFTGKRYCTSRWARTRGARRSIAFWYRRLKNEIVVRDKNDSGVLVFSVRATQ